MKTPIRFILLIGCYILLGMYYNMDGGKGQRGRVKLQIVNSEPARTCVACTFCPARGGLGRPHPSYNWAACIAPAAKPSRQIHLLTFCLYSRYSSPNIFSNLVSSAGI